MGIQNRLEVDDLDRILRFADLGDAFAVHAQREVQSSQRLKHLPKLSPRLARFDRHDRAGRSFASDEGAATCAVTKTN